MPRAKNTSNASGNTNRDRVWHGFARCELAAKDREDFKAWDVGFDEAFGELAELLPDYKLSIAYNTRNNSYVASLTGTNAEHVNHGWCLSAFAGTLVDAVRVLWFKHSVLLEADWERARVMRDEGGIG